MYCIGLDIGGANLKFADSDGRANHVAFPLWQRPHELEQTLRLAIAEFKPPDAFAVSMTGELADCYPSKQDGVEQIVRATMNATESTPTFFWQTPGEFVDAKTAIEFPMLTAAANWHALATWAARMIPDGSGLLIDVGSTTTDIVPLHNGIPVPNGRTDLQRLKSAELVYRGVKRTPMCAVLDEIRLAEGDAVRPAAELFATMWDAFLLTGDLVEDPDNTATADGRPATRTYARHRMARMLCADERELQDDDIEGIAGQFTHAMERTIANAIESVARALPGKVSACLVSGEGTFLAKRIIENSNRFNEATIISLENMLNETASSAACAFALAQLGSERIR